VAEALELREWVAEQEVEARRIHSVEWTVYWPMVSQELDTIPQYWTDYWTKDFINGSVVNESWQAWGFGKIGVVNVVVLSQILMYPASKVLQIMLAFGNSLDKCLPLMEATFERFAMETRCDVVEIVGRPGWEKKLPRFRRYAVVLRAEVQPQGVH